MSLVDILAILPQPVPSVVPAGLRLEPFDGGAIAFDAARPTVPRGRRALLRAAADRQARLEALLPLGTIIPTLVGTRLPQEDLGALLRANRPEIDRAAERLSGAVQFQVTVRWQAEAALAHFADTIHASQTVQGLRTSLAAVALDRLTEAARDVIPLPVQEDMLLNAVALVPASAIARFDRAVEAIDALWPEGFAIRQIGPSPGVSFASIGFRRISRKALRKAAQDLGVAPDVAAEDLQYVRRRALMSGQCAPERVRQAADILKLTAGLGNATPYQAFIWSEGRAAPVVAEAGAA